MVTGLAPSGNARDARARRTLGLACIALLASIALVACGGQLPQIRQEALTRSISLERTSCFGKCPTYRVTIYDDGTVLYEGEQFVRVTGPRSWQTTSWTAARLIDAFDRVGEERLTWQCDPERVATDHAGAVITVVRPEGNRTVRHDYGDPCAPEELWVLEAAIDGAAHSARWVE